MTRVGYLRFDQWTFLVSQMPTIVLPTRLAVRRPENERINKLYCITICLRCLNAERMMCVKEWLEAVSLTITR